MLWAGKLAMTIGHTCPLIGVAKARGALQARGTPDASLRMQ